MNAQAKRMLLLVLGLGCMLAIAALAQTAGEAPRISREEVRPLLGDPDVIILDARTDWAWNESDRKIKGAVRADPADVGSWAGSIPREKKIIVYCS